ncbi:hypothetical protein ACRAWC_25710 [Leifsonia sp. L25]|uniref:hypothetical protein n=1 Tax=Leifsonia sp. L25 TaxID=3423957 RepID=UPI003D685C78
MTSTVELLEIASTVAKRAAAFALQRRQDGVEIAASKSSLSDIVTQAGPRDRAVDPGCAGRGATA